MISERNVRFLAVLSVVALFIAGLGIGFAVSKLFFKDEPHRPPRRGRPQVQRLLDRFASELNLSPEQKQAVHEIMEEGRKASDQVMEEVGPKLAAVRRSLVEKISAVLSPEQRELHRKLLERGKGLPMGPPKNRPPPPGGPPGGPHGGPHGGPQGMPPPPPPNEQRP